MDEFFDRPREETPPAIERVLAEAGIGSSEAADFRQLGGGFQNWNFLARRGHDSFVLRVSKSPAVLRKEVCLLKCLEAEHVAIPVPKVLWSKIEGGAMPMAAISFLQGETLWEWRPRLDGRARRAISLELGAILARIHGHKYPSFGLLNADLQVVSCVESFADWMLGYLRSCIASPRFCSRVDRDLRRRLEDCIEAHPAFHLAESEPCLCHGDFNEKNLLANLGATGAEPGVSAVLDWEYALASTPSVDIGNLFRFSAIDPWIDATAFEAGYRDAGGRLDADWRSRACFVDLISLCDFLDSENERPTTHATARRLMDASLKRLDS